LPASAASARARCPIAASAREKKAVEADAGEDSAGDLEEKDRGGRREKGRG
jgi:hypothetical protein